MPTFALSGLLNGLLSGFANFDIQDFLLTILVLCISLSFHEVAHGWVANKLGDDTAFLAGRLTLNPLAHLDLVGSICFLIGGIGWAKPVPINPTKFDRKYTMKKGIVLTSLAGPSSNLLLAVGSAILLYIMWTFAFLAGADTANLAVNLLNALFNKLFFANIILAVFNLLPVPPLDGYKIFGALLPGQLYYKIMSYERYIGMIFLFLVIAGRGILSTILYYISYPFKMAIMLPLEFLFTQLWKLLGIS
jgi:Zn-dependent protease